jgi:alanyl-tRNA synthetase
MEIFDLRSCDATISKSYYPYFILFLQQRFYRSDIELEPELAFQDSFSYNPLMSKTVQARTPHQIREAYLQFFTEEPRNHALVPSSPLVPENDPTTLFTGSGMQPMMPYLLGAPNPKGQRLVDSQKCFRSQDIEEVGDNRHTTFFEMLGNWSLGDYFKKEQLGWFFEFLTDKVGLDPSRIYVTVFRGQPDLNIPKDTEAVEIWQQLFASKNIEAKDIDHSEDDGMQNGRIFYYDEKKNWWSRSGVPNKMPLGEPGGPDSEVFYDFGEDLNLHQNSSFATQPCHVNCDCGRFLEIGNNVFMTYVKTEKGFEPLQQKNIDFGGGLERIAAAAANDPDVFKTELFWPIIEQLQKASGKSYSDAVMQVSMRVIADHIKAATMLIIDGVFPSNKGQGYVLRRLLRRAALKAHTLGVDFVHELPITATTVLTMYDGVHNIRKSEQKALVLEAIVQELQKFQKTLAAGLKIVEKTDQVDGKMAFDLYQSYGFPLELTTELLQQKGHQLNIDDFQTEFQKHKDLSRTASAGAFKGGLADHSEVTTKYHTATHLLHAALRKILGQHVQQKGSNITGERLRFDFAHSAAMTEAEKQAVEKQINDWIAADLPVTVQTQEKQTALNSGAIAFFVEKYPDEVTVYTIGKDSDSDWISKEFCGGPHVQHTGEIGPIELQKEQSASAGVRRVYLKLKS